MVACYISCHILMGAARVCPKKLSQGQLWLDGTGGGVTGDRSSARPAPLLQGSRFSFCKWGWGWLGPDGLSWPEDMTRLSVTGRGHVT